MHKTHKKTHKNKYTKTHKKTHKSKSRIMKGSGLLEDMKLGFNNMGLKANSLWGDMKTKASGWKSSMFSSTPNYQPLANPVVAQPPYPVANPVAQTPYQSVPNPAVAQTPYQSVPNPVANQPFMGGMPAYNSYHDKFIDFSQRVHGYQTAKPLTYVSGYGGSRRKRRGGASCTIADLPYSTTETGSSYANKLTGGKRIRRRKVTKKYRKK